MNCTAPMVCILLGWSEPAPAARPATQPTPAQKAIQSPAYEVMLVKSGVEIIIKMGGKPTSILLAGVGTPRTGAKPDIDRLSQTSYLRKQITIGSKVKLGGKDATRADAQGRRRAQLYREPDGLWINNDLVAKGYATALTEKEDSAGPAFREAEKRARESRIGMWAPDFAAHAAQPSRFERVQRPRAQPRPDLSAPAMDVVPANNTGNAPYVTAPAVETGGYGWGPNLGMGAGSIVTLSDFAYDEYGNRLNEREQKQRYQNWLEFQARQAERGRQVIGDFAKAIRDQGQQGQGPTAGQNSTGPTYTPYTPYTPYTVPGNGGTNTVPNQNTGPPRLQPGPGTGKH